MMGTPGDQGVVPRAIQALFDRISNTEDWCVTDFSSQHRNQQYCLGLGGPVSTDKEGQHSCTPHEAYPAAEQ